MILNGDDPTLGVVKELFTKQVDPDFSENEFFNVFEEWLERKKEQVTIDSYKDYKSLLKHLRGFEAFRKMELKFR